LLVLSSHYTFPVSGLSVVDWVSSTLHAVGGTGVDLFFTLSGFLVGGLLMKEYQRTGTLKPRRFLVRRAFKIWPALYVLVLFHAVIGRHPIESFFWQNLLHLQNYLGSSLKQTWSLAIEEHFYLLLALLLWALVGKSPKTIAYTLLAVCVASTTARVLVVVSGDLDAAFRQTQYRLDSLLYGVLLSLIYTFYPEVYRGIADRKRLLVGCVFGLASWIVLSAPHPVLIRCIGYTVMALGFCAAVVLLNEHASRSAERLWFRAIAWVGLYSYGIYLWHGLALEPGRRLISLLSSYGVYPAAIWMIAVTAQIGAGVGAGYVMTKLVEWPFLRLRERLAPPTGKPSSIAGTPDSTASAGNLSADDSLGPGIAPDDTRTVAPNRAA
jgi:peptidoglycan/LPS O-acetylase OafA/YrhL